MKYSTYKHNNGKWYAKTGRKYIARSESETEELALVWAAKLSAEWYLEQARLATIVVADSGDWEKVRDCVYPCVKLHDIAMDCCAQYEPDFDDAQPSFYC